MHYFIIYAIVTMPLFAFGIFVKDKFISQSHVFACLVAIICVFGIILSQYKLKKQHIIWMKPFLFFLSIGILGILSSPYGTAVLPKGSIQVVGITIMLFMSLGIVLTVYRTPGFVLRLVRISTISLGVFSAIGIAQFIFWNFSSWDNVLEFSFLNDLVGGTVWNNPGSIGGIHRANSLSAEPAHFIRYLGFGLGVALIRIGLLGTNMKKEISDVVPIWAACFIIIGFFVSISILGFLLMFLTIVILFLLKSQNITKYITKIPLLVLFLILSFVTILLITGGHLQEKIATIKLIFSSSDAVSYEIKSYNSSALTIIVNREVVKHNFIRNPFLGGGLGSHPLAYEDFSPLSAYISRIEGTNAKDAASLILRLISETGFLGTSLFLWGVLAILIKARKALRLKISGDRYGPLTAVAFGIVGSCASIFLVYVIRTGHYYDILFWSMIGLTASVPFLISYEKFINTFLKVDKKIFYFGKQDEVFYSNYFI